MKKFSLGFLFGAILCTVISVYAVNSINNNPYKIFVNGEEKNIEGYNLDGYSYFKLRDIAENVGGFSVDFVDNTIQIYKEGYEPQNNIEIKKMEFTPYMKDYLTDMCYRIPDFKQNNIQTEQFIGDFIFYFYTAKDYERAELNEDGYARVPWDIETVKKQYKLLFGYNMPVYNPGGVDILEYKSLFYRDSKYYVAPSDFGEVEYTYDKTIETDDGVDVVFSRGYSYDCVGYVEEYFYGTTTFSLKKADNENGFIITSVISRDADGNEYE